jgi:hypothetical protein
MQWIFGPDMAAGHIRSPFDIDDVWPSSYSANTNEILWGAKVAARMPWITCVIRLTSYECGMDQPTFTPVQQIVERSGTLFFSFQELDSTKPAGSVKIRTETISFYLEQSSKRIVEESDDSSNTDADTETNLPGRAPGLRRHSRMEGREHPCHRRQPRGPRGGRKLGVGRQREHADAASAAAQPGRRHSRNPHGGRGG